MTLHTDSKMKPPNMYCECSPVFRKIWTAAFWKLAFLSPIMFLFNLVRDESCQKPSFEIGEIFGRVVDLNFWKRFHFYWLFFIHLHSLCPLIGATCFCTGGEALHKLEMWATGPVEWPMDMKAEPLGSKWSAPLWGEDPPHSPHHLWAHLPASFHLLSPWNFPPEHLSEI